MQCLGRSTPVYELDGARYHRIDTKEVPPGYVTVPVELDNNGQIIKSEMLAGSVGMSVSKSGLELADGTLNYDTIQPRSGWCMYEIDNPSSTN